MIENAKAKNSMDLNEFSFNIYKSVSTMKKVYIESHCPHIAELEITVGANHTIPKQISGLLSGRRFLDTLAAAIARSKSNYSKILLT